MAGHSRWAQIRHKKAGSDAKRSTLFSKLARLIAVASHEGGPDPQTNPKLRSAIEQARDADLPKENIERAIARGGGANEGANLRPLEYEAYGPGGIALLISGLSDNPNRTTNELKRALADGGGRLAETGSVAWMFERRIAVDFARPIAEPEATELILIDAGAEDTARLEDRIRALVAPERQNAFLQSVNARGLTPIASALTPIPQNPIALGLGQRRDAEALIAALEEHPDVIDVWTNLAPERS